MKYNAEPGIIYDAIVYNNIYFCKDAMFKNIRPYIGNDEDVFRYYNEFLKTKNLKSPPDDFYPFFFFQNMGPCVLTTYFNKNFNFFTGTKNDFLDLFKDTAKFKRFVIFYYLEKYADNIDIDKVINSDIVAVSKALVLLRDHGSYMESFIRVFCDFNALVDDLMQYLDSLIEYVKKFHQKYKDIILKAIEDFTDSQVFEAFLKKVGIKKPVKLSEQTFSGCLLHQTVLKFQLQDDNFAFVLSTYAFKTVLLYMQFKNIDECSLSKLFANPIICDIIKELAKQELTISKLSYKIHISRTTVDRFVCYLRSEFAIIISRTDGKEKYYKLNPEYFIAAKNSFDKMYENLIERQLC